MKHNRSRYKVHGNQRVEAVSSNKQIGKSVYILYIAAKNCGRVVHQKMYKISIIQ